MFEKISLGHWEKYVFFRFLQKGNSFGTRRPVVAILYSIKQNVILPTTHTADRLIYKYPVFPTACLVPFLSVLMWRLHAMTNAN